MSATLRSRSTANLGSTCYPLNNGSRAPWTKIVRGNGPHTVAYYLVDLFGNVETTKTMTFLIIYVSPIEIAIAGGFGITATVNNTESENLTGVVLDIQLSGGIIFLGKHKADIEDIQAGESATLQDFVIDFGTTTVTVKANEIQKTRQMKVILIFLR